jgi:hypothetical protein
MTIQSSHDEPWLQDGTNERVLILAIIAMIAMSPFVMWWFHG